MNWPHRPTHWLFEPSLYIVTAGTYRKLPHLNSLLRLDFFQEVLVRIRERIWLGLARLGSVGQSLPLRCRITIPSGHAAEICR